jgi:hypothetical protein
MQLIPSERRRALCALRQRACGWPAWREIRERARCLRSIGTELRSDRGRTYAFTSATQLLEDFATLGSVMTRLAHRMKSPTDPVLYVIANLLFGYHRLHLAPIETRRPGSVRELAMLARREESNLSRTLKKLQEAGIVAFEKGPLTLDLDLTGVGSVASVERSSMRQAPG